VPAAITFLPCSATPPAELACPSFGSCVVQTLLPGSWTVLGCQIEVCAACPAASRTTMVSSLPGLLCGALVTGNTRGAPAGPVATTTPSSSRSASTASALTT